MEDDLEQVTVRLVDGTTEVWDAAEMLANGVLKVSKAATSERDGQPAPEMDAGIEVTYYAAHAWVSVTPSTRSQEPIKRGLYI
jgi:hypothetical protein